MTYFEENSCSSCNFYEKKKEEALDGCNSPYDAAIEMVAFCEECKKIVKNFQKPLDKLKKVCYN